MFSKIEIFNALLLESERREHRPQCGEGKDTAFLVLFLKWQSGATLIFTISFYWGIHRIIIIGCEANCFLRDKLSLMSQQQGAQHRSAAVNGPNHSRPERDQSSCYDNSSIQSARFCSDNSVNTGIDDIFFNHISTDNIHYANNNRTREGNVNISKSGGFGQPMHDRFLFMTTCLVGRHVEVQVKNGSIFSGIFHSTHAENDNGVVLKMVQLIKDGTVKGGKPDTGFKAPIKTLIIMATDLVQVMAKDLPVPGDDLENGYGCGNRHDIVTDSVLSHAYHFGSERELKPWMPEKDASEGLGLEDTFQNTWNRNWDQFATNKMLFGVESTFDEELYTTKLEKGPQMESIERVASRIAREIEGQVTRNFHLAEERGTHFSEELDLLDEESRFSSVLREMDDDVGEDYEDEYADNNNEKTFGSNIAFEAVDFKKKLRHAYQPSSSGSSEVDESSYQSLVSETCPQISSSAGDHWEFRTGKFDQIPSQVGDKTGREIIESNLQDDVILSKGQLRNNDREVFLEVLQNKVKALELPSKIKVNGDKLILKDQQQAFLSKEEKSLLTASSRSNLPQTAAACAPPASALPMPTSLSGSVATSSIHAGSESTSHTTELSQIKTSKCSVVVPPINSQEQFPFGRMGILSSLATDLPSTNPVSKASSGSSIESTSSEKLTLNPYAKEFKLNPNAKSFTSYYTGIRSSSPVAQGPLHMPIGVPPVLHMQSLPVIFGESSLTQQPKQSASIGPYNNALTASGVTTSTYLQPAAILSPSMSGTNILSSFPAQSAVRISAGQQVGQSVNVHQSIVYNSQSLPMHSASAYIHQNGQLYPQQMMFGQHGQAVYITPFPQDARTTSSPKVDLSLCNFSVGSTI
ncbi:polyadenylate-binding protein-interacting protein 4 isoform X2 [Cryptomeria japonica]|uniref:polyadenylate-binding protein-interacting protein 4 isoform X2 n=1 Tax=Cryptomeria japonica TaxID=3369 RepID=UPI0025AC0C3B|nr:polyadenylate-binding protein-interacting protein 4 isoform X2 [Cryptomeria japonica]